MAILKQIQRLPLGYSEVIFRQKKYGVNRTDFNNGNSIKIYTEELGGNDFINLNYYITSKNKLLKPCEMPEQKVIHFLKNMEVS